MCGLGLRTTSGSRRFELLNRLSQISVLLFQRACQHCQLSDLLILHLDHSQQLLILLLLLAFLVHGDIQCMLHLHLDFCISLLLIGLSERFVLRSHLVDVATYFLLNLLPGMHLLLVLLVQNVLGFRGLPQLPWPSPSSPQPVSLKPPSWLLCAESPPWAFRPSHSFCFSQFFGSWPPRRRSCESLVFRWLDR